MKNRKNKVIIFTILAIVLGTSGFYVSNKVNAANGVNAAKGENVTNASNGEDTAKQAYSNDLGVYLMDKNETVYVNLNYDGTISKMNVVNYFKAQDLGIYQDYGNYENITNLTNDIEPVIEEDSIRWNIAGSNKDFYYQGQLSGGDLPWKFDIEYKLEGIAVKAEDLTGAAGELVIVINVEENLAAEEYFRQNYMMQITVPLNMQNATLISAPGAVQMIAGHTKTLAFTMLPQSAGHFEIIARVQDFAMEAIDIAMMKADLSSYMDVDEMTEGFGAMSEGMEELKNGTVILKEGITELSGGIGLIGSGLNDLSLGTPQLSEGMDQFDDGFATFKGSLRELSTGSSQMKEGLQEISDNGKQFLIGYQGIEAGISSMLVMKQELQTMAGEMAKSTDPQTVMLAQTILGQLDGLIKLQTGLETLNTSFDLYTQGVEQAADQYTALNTGISALPGGFGQLTGGYQEIKDGNNAVYSAVEQLNKGLTDISTSTTAIPDKVQLLADGQLEMKEGIDQAVKEIESLTRTDAGTAKIQPVSFVAPGKIVPNSVQFVLRTPAIEKVTRQIKSAETEVKEMGFWDKLFDLFR